jgi:hypothetical protein
MSAVPSNGGSPSSASRKLLSAITPKSIGHSPASSQGEDVPGRLSTALSAAFKSFRNSSKSQNEEGDAHSIADH